jgi:MFS superfamily sulfate permease-like transporter
MLAGIIQMLLGWLRLGSYIQLVPRPVTSGFMTGIGCAEQYMQMWPPLRPGQDVLYATVIVSSQQQACDIYCFAGASSSARSGPPCSVMHLRHPLWCVAGLSAMLIFAGTMQGMPNNSPLSYLQAAIQNAAGWVANINTQALLVGGVSLLCSLFTPVAITRFVPGSLLGLVAGTLTSVYTRSSTCVYVQRYGGLLRPSC